MPLTVFLFLICLGFPSVACAKSGSFYLDEADFRPQSNSKEFELEIKSSFSDENFSENDIYFVRPMSFCLDSDHNVYILDHLENHVLVLDSKGNFKRKFGRKGQGPGDLNRPHSIHKLKNQLLVHDTSNRRLQFFSDEGEHEKSIKLAKIYSAFVLDGSGRIFAAPTILHPNSPLIEVFSLSGEPLFSFGKIKDVKVESPMINKVHLAIDDNGQVFVAHWFFPEIRKYSRQGDLLAEITIPHERFDRYGRENRSSFHSEQISAFAWFAAGSMFVMRAYSW